MPPVIQDSNPDSELLARIDERTLAILLETFITEDEFSPVRLIAYGAVGVVLSAVLVAAVAALV